VIEIKGVSPSSLLVHFGARIEAELSPAPIFEDLTNCLTSDVPSDIQEQVGSFYRSVFSGVNRAGHGTLAAVISARRRTVPERFRDGIILAPRVSVAERVQSVLAKNDCSSNTQLQACAALITGMLLSDGVTIFGSDGTVRAYNVFIKHPKGRANVSGGARMRTFDAMADLLGEELVGAFIQSQDGQVQFRGNKR